jgi:hypothetical protein
MFSLVLQLEQACGIHASGQWRVERVGELGSRHRCAADTFWRRHSKCDAAICMGTVPVDHVPAKGLIQAGHVSLHPSLPKQEAEVKGHGPRAFIKLNIPNALRTLLGLHQTVQL